MQIIGYRHILKKWFIGYDSSEVSHYRIQCSVQFHARQNKVAVLTAANRGYFYLF